MLSGSWHPYFLQILQLAIIMPYLTGKRWRRLRAKEKAPAKCRGFIGRAPYQLSFNPNWIWRGSKDAVGLPASVHRTLTSDTFKRLNALKTSTIPSNPNRSVTLKCLATRMSLKIVNGLRPTLRPRLPRSGAEITPSVGLLSMKHAGWIHPVGE